MAKILVTGATGFLGRHLVPALRRTHDVRAVSSVDGDVGRRGTWATFPDADVLIPLAGRTFVPESWTDPAGFLEANLLGAVWGGDYCRERKASMVYLSSYLYGNAGSMPIPESAPLDTPNPYALSNKLAEDVCSFYASQYGVPSTILRPFNVYGPGQSDRFLIPSLVRQARSGGIVEIKDASPRRDYVYVEDVVNAIVKAAERKDGYGVFNIGTGHSHSVAEVIDMLCDLVGRDIEVRDAGERRPAEIMDSRADVARAREVLGWTPHWTLRDGLARMLEA